MRPKCTAERPLPAIANAALLSGLKDVPASYVCLTLTQACCKSRKYCASAHLLQTKLR